MKKIRKIRILDLCFRLWHASEDFCNKLI